jgi:hypothetical protein
MFAQFKTEALFQLLRKEIPKRDPIALSRKEAMLAELKRRERAQ